MHPSFFNPTISCETLLSYNHMMCTLLQVLSLAEQLQCIAITKYAKNYNRGIFLDFFSSVHCIQHCFICRPSDSIVSADSAKNCPQYLVIHSLPTITWCARYRYSRGRAAAVYCYCYDQICPKLPAISCETLPSYYNRMMCTLHTGTVPRRSSCARSRRRFSCAAECAKLSTRSWPLWPSPPPPPGMVALNNVWTVHFLSQDADLIFWTSELSLNQVQFLKW